MKQNQWKKVSAMLEEIIAIEPSARLDFLKNSILMPKFWRKSNRFWLLNEAEDFMSLPAKDFSVGTIYVGRRDRAKSADRSKYR